MGYPREERIHVIETSFATASGAASGAPFCFQKHVWRVQALNDVTYVLSKKNRLAHRLVALYCDRMILALRSKYKEWSSRNSVVNALPEAYSILLEATPSWDPNPVGFPLYNQYLDDDWYDTRTIERLRETAHKVLKFLSQHDLDRYVEMPSIASLVARLTSLFAEEVQADRWETRKHTIITTLEDLRKFIRILPPSGEEELFRAWSTLRRAIEFIRNPLELKDPYIYDSSNRDDTGPDEFTWFVDGDEIPGNMADVFKIDLFFGASEAAFYRHPCRRADCDGPWRRYDRDPFNDASSVWKALYEADSEGVVLPLWGCLHHGLIAPWTLGSIAEYLTKRPDADRLLLLIKMARCINWLHRKNVVHGRIKETAFQIIEEDEEPKVYITKFYDARTLRYSDGKVRYRSAEYDDTHWVVAPECGSSNKYMYGKPADIWPFGGLIMLVMGKRLRLHDYKLAMAPYPGERKLPEKPMDEAAVERGMDEELYGLFLDCWSYDPAFRPTIEQVIQRLEACHYQWLAKRRHAKA
ncbi:hypothetical protein PUNSTDRAFT_127618 [Punctularia strigosozonata HHB-11173 SS5]|uniref:uncharacterized protein n=1 Tax=Punctularia strigosozonata (strain HHB-11173) TaxID=741275 RepID=UPI0004417361|nr:uncharacterized protein PUNSTDRAFT_127618 [Punctularia strigosozonata HHB-11173 SS5]EIN06268.1 hypothetical protein PUNSTDRAFT_127618 [Punctularia strigosozonata HHB-11173 SS5]